MPVDETSELSDPLDTIPQDSPVYLGVQIGRCFAQIDAVRRETLELQRSHVELHRKLDRLERAIAARHPGSTPVGRAR